VIRLERLIEPSWIGFFREGVLLAKADNALRVFFHTRFILFDARGALGAITGFGPKRRVLTACFYGRND